MKETISLLIVLLFTFSCKKQPDKFEYAISGTIEGHESGELYIGESKRIGDEIPIPYNNYKFEYKVNPQTFTLHKFYSTFMVRKEYFQSLLNLVRPF